MKTKTPVAPAQQDALTSFTEELARSEKEQARLTGVIDQHQGELATLDERARIRAEQETTAQRAIDTARNLYTETQLRAELLTSGELAKAARSDLSTLEQHLRAAQEAQIKLLSRTQQEADADERKRFRLQEDVDRAHQALQHLAERQHVTQGLKQKALFDQAEAMLRARLDTLAAMQAQRDQQQAILANMDTEIEAYTQRAIQELASYPEQQHAFSAHLGYSDHFTRILEAEVTFIDLVLSEGAGVELPYEVKRKLNMTFLDLAQLLSFDHSHWWPALSVQGSEPDLLLERRDLLTRLLALYRETKA